MLLADQCAEQEEDRQRCPLQACTGQGADIGPAGQRGKQGHHHHAALDQITHRIDAHGMHRKQRDGGKNSDADMGVKTRLGPRFIGKRGVPEQFGHQQPNGIAGGQVQHDIEGTLHGHTLAEQRLYPDKAAIGQHPHLGLDQAAITAKNGAVRQPSVVKYQAVVQAQAINREDGGQERQHAQRPENF